VAPCEDGAIYSSENGGPWIREDPSPGFRFLDIATDGQTFVVVGPNKDDNAGRVLVGRPGHWNVALDTYQTRFQVVFWGGAKFFASGWRGINDGDPSLWSSPDGFAWAPVSPEGVPIFYFIRSMVYGNGQYLAFDLDPGVALRSPDGLHWERAEVPFISTVLSAAFEAGRFAVLVRQELDSSMTSLWTSEDGVNWFDFPIPAQDGALMRVRSGGGRFLAVGISMDSTSPRGVVFENDSGSVWVRHELCATIGLIDVAWTPAIYTAIGIVGNLITSSNGANWTGEASGQTGGGLVAVASDRQSVVLAGGDTEYNQGVLLKSDGGDNWHRVAGEAGCSLKFRTLSFGGGRFLAVFSTWEDGSTVFATSTDGNEWTYSLPYPALGDQFPTLAYGVDRWVLVAEDGKILTSLDGQNWTQVDSGTTRLFFNVAYGGGVFVAVGEAGVRKWSPDGIHWTDASSPGEDPWWRIAYGNGLFLLFTYQGTMVKSTDGIHWKTALGLPFRAYSVAFAQGHFVVSNGLYTATSTDGSEWLIQKSDLEGMSAPFAMAEGPSALYAVGSNTTILKSTCAPLRPFISSYAFMGYPFRILLTGFGFRPDSRAWVNGWPVSSIKWRSNASIILKKGRDLKAALRTANPAAIRVENPDGTSDTVYWFW
jgi:hypothetical protein